MSLKLLIILVLCEAPLPLTFLWNCYLTVRNRRLMLKVGDLTREPEFRGIWGGEIMVIPLLVPAIIGGILVPHVNSSNISTHKIVSYITSIVPKLQGVAKELNTTPHGYTPIAVSTDGWAISYGGRVLASESAPSGYSVKGAFYANGSYCFEATNGGYAHRSFYSKTGKVTANRCPDPVVAPSDLKAGK